MSLQAVVFQGQPALRLILPAGGECTVAMHGAHLLSWITADGVERIYLSPSASFDGKSAIRGGVPICWPQFNQRGPLPKHGFARNLPWQAKTPPGTDDGDTLMLVLRANDATRALWPHAFQATLSVTPGARALRIGLEIENTDSEPWAFTAALHSYLRVDEIATAALMGLQHARRWDAVRDVRLVESEAALHFDAEFDSVYAAPSTPLRLVQPSGTLEITQSGSFRETVVWNPGPRLSASMADLPDDGWQHMLCVEAACIDEPQRLPPGAAWRGWQQLTVV